MHVDTPALADRRLRGLFCALAVAFTCIAIAAMPTRGEDAPAAVPAAVGAPDTTLLHHNAIVDAVSGTQIKYRFDAVGGDPATSPVNTSYLLHTILWMGDYATQLQESAVKTDWPGIALPQENAPKSVSTGIALRINQKQPISDIPKGVPYTSIVSETAPLELAGKTWETRHVLAKGGLVHQGTTYSFEFEYWFADSIPGGGLLKRESRQLLPLEARQTLTFTYMGHEVPATPAPYPRDEKKALELYMIAMTQSSNMMDFMAEAIDTNAVESMLEAGEPQLALKYPTILKTNAPLADRTLKALLTQGDYKAVLNYYQGISTDTLLYRFTTLLASAQPPIPMTDEMLDELAARVAKIYETKKAVALHTTDDSELMILARLLLERGRRAEAESLTQYLDGPCAPLEVALAAAADKADDGEGLMRHIAKLKSISYAPQVAQVAAAHKTWMALDALSVESPARPNLLDVLRVEVKAVTDPINQVILKQQLAGVLSKGTAEEKEEAKSLLNSTNTPLVSEAVAPIAEHLGIDLVAEHFERTYQPSESFTYWESNLAFLLALRRAGSQARYDAMAQELVDRQLTYTVGKGTTRFISPIVDPLFEELLANGKLALAAKAAVKIKSFDEEWVALNLVANWVVQNGKQADWEAFKEESPDSIQYYANHGINRALSDGDHALGLWLCQLRWPGDAKELRLVNFQIAMQQAAAGQSDAALAGLEAIRQEATFAPGESDLVAWIYIKSGQVTTGVEYFEEHCVRSGELMKISTPQHLLGRDRGMYVADIVAARVVAGYDVAAYEQFARGPKDTRAIVHYIAMGLARGCLGP